MTEFPFESPAGKGVALDGLASGFADQAHQFLAAHALRSGRAGIVVDLFFDHRAVDVVGAEAQRDLRNLRRSSSASRTLMCGKLSSTRRLTAICLISSMPVVLGRCCKRSVVGMKGQRNKGLEAAGFILQGAQLQQMVDAVFVVFYVAVEHGRVRLQSDLVGELAVSSH